jgi:hypothetical protein
MKRFILLALFGLSLTFGVKAQDTLKNTQLKAGIYLKSYSRTYTAGNVFELVGMTTIICNSLIPTNPESKSGMKASGTKYDPTALYVVGGAFTLTGYILKQWVSPEFIKKSGLVFMGNSASMDIRWRHKHFVKSVPDDRGYKEFRKIEL